MEANARTTTYKSCIFEEWAHHLTAEIGHHSSILLSQDIPFSSAMKVVQMGDVSVIELAGSSSIRLHRHQPQDRVVIWLPREGWVQEMINGEIVCAEPGSAMVCLPGDELIGETTSSLCGTSIALPFSLFGDLLAWRGFSIRHIAEGSEALSLLECAHELVAAFIHDSSVKQHLVEVLVDQLLFWKVCQDPDQSKNTRGPVERRAVVAAAREWMHARLKDSFRITDLAADLNLSSRSLQLCFREEIGRSPSEELQRLRFRMLRRNIELIPPFESSLEDLIHDCGLTFSSSTTRLYREWCGETPSQTSMRAHSS